MPAVLSKPSLPKGAVLNTANRVSQLPPAISIPSEPEITLAADSSVTLTPEQEIVREVRIRHAARTIHKEAKKEDSQIHSDYN